MHDKKYTIDIIDKVLDACYKNNPDGIFIQSLMHQYEERGNLSKKQLEGLYLKAKNVNDIPESWLGTLEAIIKKMPTRYKSALPEKKPLFEKDKIVGETIAHLLAKAPQHKQVLFLKKKYDNNEILSATEIAELVKFRKLLDKK